MLELQGLFGSVEFFLSVGLRISEMDWALLMLALVCFQLFSSSRIFCHGPGAFLWTQKNVKALT